MSRRRSRKSEHRDQLAVLVNADARALPLRDGVAQTTVMSPPYPGLRDYGHPAQIGGRSLVEYRADIRAALAENFRVLRPDGTVWVILGAVYFKKRYIDVASLIAAEAERVGFTLRQRLVWRKVGAMPETVTDRLTQTDESVLLFVKDVDRYVFNLDALREPHMPASLRRAAWEKHRTSDNGLKSQRRAGKVAANRVVLNPKGHPPGSVLTFAPARFNGAHFAVVSEKLVAYLIALSTDEGDLVLDSFGGACTVGAVAQRLGRRSVCVDLNFRYLAEVAPLRFASVRDVPLRPLRPTSTRRRMERIAEAALPDTRPRGRKRSDSDQLSQRQLAAQQGISRDTLWKAERLARDFPELHGQVVAGELSVNAAAVAAGIVRPRAAIIRLLGDRDPYRPPGRDARPVASTVTALDRRGNRRRR